MNTKIDISVIAPCFNEERNVEALVTRLNTTFEKHNINGEIILVDDASSDKTSDEIKKMSAKFKDVILVSHRTNLGLFRGWHSGIAASHGKYVCLIDADLQNPPEEVARLYYALQTETVDLVQGVRSSIGRLRGSRYILSRGLNILLNVFFGMHAKDNKSGLVMGPKETIKDIITYRKSYYYPHTFLRVNAKAKGYAVKEIETLFVERKVGKSFISRIPIGVIFKCMLDLAKGFFEFRLNSKINNELERFLAEHPPIKEPTPYRGWRKLIFELYFLTMPLHKWMITRKARRLFLDLRRSQWLKPEDMKKFQELKLRKMVHHIYNHVPYYQKLFKQNNLKPNDIQTIEDLQKLPFLTKDIVSENIYFDLFADNHNKKHMSRITTSGSTAAPFIMYADRHQLEMRFASTLRSLEWTGWRFGDPTVRLWHQTIAMSPIQIVKERIDAWFMRRLFIPAFEIGEDNIDALLGKMRKKKPVLVDGYAESFNLLAMEMKKKNILGLNPKAIMTSAQIMPEQVRKIIETEFKSKVFDKYGSREFSGIAYEDENHDGHLIQGESYIVEIIKNGRPAKLGEIGEVVITDLNNFHFPLIRYRIGDLAESMPEIYPESGRGFPLLGRIEGRSQAVVVCPNGKWVPGTFFSHFFKDYDHIIKQFQVVQETKDLLILKIIPNTQYNDNDMNDIIKQLEHFVGKEMNINIEIVDNIPLVRTGKRNGVISKLKIDFQDLNKEEAA